MTPAGPIGRSDRIRSMDALRGLALLGILPANVLIFAMYFAAANDLTVAGGASGLNLAAWAFLRIFVDGKMRCLFSMVFGASAILLTSRAEQRDCLGSATGPTAADIYYRRNIWLLLFGIAHGFLLFWGDILYSYALCALILFPFRALPAKKLLLVGTLFIAANACWSARDALHQSGQRTLAAQADAAAKERRTPSNEQAEAQKALAAQRKIRKPSAQDLEDDARKWRGSPLGVIGERARQLAAWHELRYYDPANFDTWSMMFIGMGLFGLGIFSAERPYRDYIRIVILGYGVGIPMNAFAAWFERANNFDRLVHAWLHVAYDIERLSVALGHMAVLMILCKAGKLRPLTDRLAAIGQTALTNYILHSVICTFVFTGFGLGLYDRLERYQIYYVVLACWMISVLASPMWLRHYRYGPLEWCWRSLTYWKRLPMRVKSVPEAVGTAVA
jgi:uncharacterized protein